MNQTPTTPIESWLDEAKAWQKKFASKAKKEPLAALEGLGSALVLLERASEIAKNELDIAGLLKVHNDANEISAILQNTLIAAEAQIVEKSEAHEE